MHARTLLHSLLVKNLFLSCLFAVIAVHLIPNYAQAAGTSLRFFGNGVNDIDRVKIQIDDPTNNDPGPPADVGNTDFTLEFWLKGQAADNTAGAQTCGANINWINGNIVIDRDRFSQDRKYGLSIAGGLVIFGVSGDGSGDLTICSTTNVLDNAWHHIAVQRRRSDGYLWLFIDGVLEAEQDGPDGDISYPDNGVPGNFCGGPCTNSDPYLVIGAEKHDAGASFPSFNGFLDELRLSTVLRYPTNFWLPWQPFYPDDQTAALYHFDSAGGNQIVDSAENTTGNSHGVRQFGGTPTGPIWSSDTPGLTAPSITTIQTLLSTGLNRAIAIKHANDGSGRLFIVEQAGLIRIYDPATNTILPTNFLNISTLVDDSNNEQGLLGLAFHPDYANNGYFFVNYTYDPGPGDDRTRVARYSVSGGNPNVASTTETVLFEAEQFAGNHNGGDMHFGPDGYLYISIGDGGQSGDQECNGQKRDTLPGSMLRIDVDGTTPAGPNGLCGLNAANYSIPADNPYEGTTGPGSGRCDEIWSYGLRNPWRVSFDRLTGDLFMADVGQFSREEINLQPANGIGGENYGWNRMEGNACYTNVNNPDVNTNCPAGIPACFNSAYTDPIIDYSHSNGNCSVTGGYRYRGARAPHLVGTYFYGDYCTGNIWQTRPNDSDVWSTSLFYDSPRLIPTFGEDQWGEIYFSGLSDFVSPDGGLFRLTHSTFTDVPLNHAFWSDVESAVMAGLFPGCQSTEFCGDNVLTRRELARAITIAGAQPGFVPTAPTGTFADISVNHLDAPYVESLYSDGISEGCLASPLSFCPHETMTRKTFSFWLVRAIYGALFVPPPATGLFSDLALADPATPFIEHLYNNGIIDACDSGGPLLICPQQVITRFQAAVQLSRGFDLYRP